jgi:methylisocitrate lyase
MKPTTQLRRLLQRPQILVAPGAADALSARLIERAGFDAVYATGAGISNALLGVPDIGLITMSEMVDQVRRIVEAVDIPIIADADTGYGNPLNVMRTVRVYEKAGVAALQIEDQVTPKRCGHFAGKEVVPASEMVQKIRAACEARTDPDLVIIARTDSLATHGFDEAIQRGRLYANAGADVIFVDAPTTPAQVESLPQQIPVPLLFNMTEGAKTPLFNHTQLQKLGYKIVIHPNLALRVALKATGEALAILRESGSSETLLPRMIDWDTRQQLVRLPEYDALEKKFVLTDKGQS